MGETPANDYPIAADAPTNFYVESALLGFGRLPAAKVAHTFGATVGQIPYANSSGEIAWLEAPDADEVLIGSGGLPVWGQGFAFKRIGQSIISSAVSSIVFSNIPSSGYGEYLLLLNDFVTAGAGATDGLYIQVSTDNGSTWKTTSGDYVTQAGTNRTALNGLGIICPASTSASPGMAASCQIIGLGVANRVTALSFTATRNVTGGAGLEIPTTALSCYRNAREQDNAIRIISSTAANLTAGKATLYGIVE